MCLQEKKLPGGADSKKENGNPNKPAVVPALREKEQVVEDVDTLLKKETLKERL